MIDSFPNETRNIKLTTLYRTRTYLCYYITVSEVVREATKNNIYTYWDGQEIEVACHNKLHAKMAATSGSC